MLESKGLTQAGIAKTLGITRASVSDWVHGRSLPNEHNLARLASITGETEASLLGVRPGKESPARRNLARLEERLGATRLGLLADVAPDAVDALLAENLLEKALKK